MPPAGRDNKMIKPTTLIVELQELKTILHEKGDHYVANKVGAAQETIQGLLFDIGMEKISTATVNRLLTSCTKALAERDARIEKLITEVQHYQPPCNHPRSARQDEGMGASSCRICHRVWA